MTCSKCETEIQDNYNYCPNCGLNLNLKIDLLSLKEDLKCLYLDNYPQRNILDYDSSALDKYPKGSFCFSDYEHTGGYSGGNCWNDDVPTYSSDSSAIPDFSEISNVLKKAGFKESVYLNYLNKFGEHIRYKQFEYYGNSSEYLIFAYNIDSMIDYLIQNS